MSNFPTDNSNLFGCQVRANANLSQSLTYVQSAYEATLTRQTIQASSGLFIDLNLCQQSTATVALTFSCPYQYYYRNAGSFDGQEVQQVSNTLLPRFNITEAVEHQPLRTAPAVVNFIKSSQ